MRKSSRPVMRGPQENFTIAIIRCHKQFRLAEGFGVLNVIFEINFIFHSFFLCANFKVLYLNASRTLMFTLSAYTKIKTLLCFNMQASSVINTLVLGYYIIS